MLCPCVISVNKQVCSLSLLGLWFPATSRCSSSVIWTHSTGRLSVTMQIFSERIQKHLLRNHVFPGSSLLTDDTQLQLVNKMTCLTLNWGECIWLQQWHITKEVGSFARYYIPYSPYRRKTLRVDSGLRSHGSDESTVGENKPTFFPHWKFCIL